MKDPIKELEEQLVKYEIYLMKLKNEITSIASDGGATITKEEAGKMRRGQRMINALRREIVKKKELLEKVDMGGVLSSYGELDKRLGVLINQLNERKEEWRTHIKEVSTAYGIAYVKYNEAIKAQEEYDAAINNIANSILSIGGTSLLSWLSDTGKLVKLLNVKSQSYIDVLEDAAQGAVDKAISLGVINISFNFSEKQIMPFLFEKRLELEVDRSISAMTKVLINLRKAGVAVSNALNELNILNKGDAKKEYKLYLQVLNDVSAIEQEVSCWSNIPIPNTDYKGLSLDFERQMWACWLPSLKKIVVNKVRNVEVKNEYYSSWGISNAIVSRIGKIIKLKDTPIGEGGLSYISKDDVKYLVNWAETFQMTARF